MIDRSNDKLFEDRESSTLSYPAVSSAGIRGTHWNRLQHWRTAAAPILFSFCDFVVWLHVTVRYIYIIREATVVLLH